MLFHSAHFTLDAFQGSCGEVSAGARLSGIAIEMPAGSAGHTERHMHTYIGADVGGSEFAFRQAPITRKSFRFVSCVRTPRRLWMRRGFQVQISCVAPFPFAFAPRSLSLVPCAMTVSSGEF